VILIFLLFQNICPNARKNQNLKVSLTKVQLDSNIRNNGKEPSDYKNIFADAISEELASTKCKEISHWLKHKQPCEELTKH